VDAAKSKHRTNRLGVIHLLGWTLGCAAVLAIVRLGSASGSPTLADSLRQLGYGLTYGTAASGLGLFLWRWRTGSGSGPTQPGHWLLVFSGIGLLLDLGTSGVYMLYLKSVEYPTFSAWLSQQLAVWSLAAVIGVVALFCLRGASPCWTLAVCVTVLALTLNVAADAAALVGAARGAGTWTWYVPTWAHLATAPLTLPFVWTAELADRLRGLPRDWLHLVGIVAVRCLGLVDFAVQLNFLLTPWP